MSVIRISWEGDLSEEQADILNDTFTLMEMQKSVEDGLVSKEEVEKEIDRLLKKYEA